MGECIYPPSNFKNVLGQYNFFIISNLFDNNNLYGLSGHNRKCANKCFIFGEALRIRGKKFKQNLPKNCSKNTKMAFAVYKLLNIFRRACPRTPLKPFLFLNLLQIYPAGKNTLEKTSKFNALIVKKFLDTPLT